MNPGVGLHSGSKMLIRLRIDAFTAEVPAHGAVLLKVGKPTS